MPKNLINGKSKIYYKCIKIIQNMNNINIIKTYTKKDGWPKPSTQTNKQTRLKS